MPQTNLNIRIDEELKKRFDMLCEDIGMSMSTAMCIFAKKAVSEQRIPFDLTANVDLFYNKSNMRAISDSMEQIRYGYTISKSLEELEALESD